MNTGHILLVDDDPVFVTSIGAGGAVTGMAIDLPGAGYSISAHNPTTATSGSGSGMTVQITAVGGTPDNFIMPPEYPLWNAAQHGPDLIDAGVLKILARNERSRAA